MRGNLNLIVAIVKVVTFSLILFLAQGSPSLSAEPVQLPSLGVIPPEPLKTEPEVKTPIEFPSLGVTPLKTTAPEKEPVKLVQLPSLGK